MTTPKIEVGEGDIFYYRGYLRKIVNGVVYYWSPSNQDWVKSEYSVPKINKDVSHNLKVQGISTERSKRERREIWKLFHKIANEDPYQQNDYLKAKELCEVEG